MSPRIEDYDVLDVIGSGSFGTCFKVRHKVTSQLFVWKAIDYGKLSEESKKNLVSEVNLLSKLNHPNIVKYYDRILHKETTTLYIITEWCQGGDLAKLVKSAKSTGQILKEDFIWRVLYQVSKAVQVCHTTLCQFTVLHRDIKPANVFLDEDGNAKLGDFGLARVVDLDEDCSETLVGTPYYMSPEVVRGQRYNRKSDIWALGCLVYELCALTPPFSGCNLKDLQCKIKIGKYAPIPSHYSENLVKVISFMLSIKHEYRPTIEMILHHPLVVQNIKSFQKPPRQRIAVKTMESVCVDALKNLSMATEPEDVTQNLFKEKWMHRLEALRERESKLKEREQGLAAKERTLMNKERHLVLKERKSKDRLALFDFKNRRKDSKVSDAMNTSRDTEFSADPGDTSVLPTSAKLDPHLFPQPKFSRSKSERRTKHVTFPQEPNPVLKHPTRPESGGSRSNSSEGTVRSCRREPFKRLFSQENRRSYHENASTLRTLSSEASNSSSERKMWLGPLRFSQNKENVIASAQDTDGVVIKSSKKPDKTFKLIQFI
uniref:non-specific serine/threonine protein kinase n=1 Tax=Lygus hesperus TaxID=30085 RepID=A0A146LN46_LYGHE